MTTSGHNRRTSWSARLLIGFVLLLAGAGAAFWALAHYPPVARLAGVVPPAADPRRAQPIAAMPAANPGVASLAATVADAERLAGLEARLARVESMSQSAAGSAGRADALLIAFAARRAIDRGVALGYLENLLVQRFAAQHQAAVSTVITASRHPVRLSDLETRYEQLGPVLRRGAPSESFWTGLSRELGSMVEVRRADRAPADPSLRYRRASQQLVLGRVDIALAETMRMPGAANAGPWVDEARRYIATQRALDELESAALLGSNRGN